jgi:hypothetical protein
MTPDSTKLNSHLLPRIQGNVVAILEQNPTNAIQVNKLVSSNKQVGVSSQPDFHHEQEFKILLKLSHGV